MVDDSPGLSETASAIASMVSDERLWRRHMEMAKIGAIAGGGVNRQALSGEDIKARDLLIKWGRQIGLVEAVDPIANLFLRLDGRDPDLPPLLVGSHMDSQPAGGRFDGIFGVLAGLEVVEAYVAADVRPERSIEVVAWTNEEGSRFAPGSMGSLCFAGQAKPEDFHPVCDDAGVALADALRATLAATPEAAKRSLGFPIAGYLEAHIEQGPILETEGLPVGIVQGIQGSRQFEVFVSGEAAHAGTTPRSVRRDALQHACYLITKLYEVLIDPEDTLRFTVGRISVHPNAPNSVADKVTFSIDLRHPDEKTLDEASDRVAQVVESVDMAENKSCKVEKNDVARRAPCQFHPGLTEALSEATKALSIPSKSLMSGAFHDAQAIASVAPTAMVFVPCHLGISHNPAEYADQSDLFAGAKTLAAASYSLVKG